MALSAAEDWQAAIDKLEAGVAQMDKLIGVPWGDDDRLTFAFDAPGRRMTAAELTRPKAVAIIADMKKEKLLCL